MTNLPTEPFDALRALDLVAHRLEQQGEREDAAKIDRARALVVRGDRQGAIRLIAETQCYHRAVMQEIFGKIEQALA